MKQFVNYIYSLLIRSCTNKDGEFSDYVVRKSLPFILFGFGGPINLIAYPFFNDPRVLVFGLFISPIAWLLWNLLIGFKQVESVKKFDQIDASALLILILIGLIGIFLLPVGIDYLIIN